MYIEHRQLQTTRVTRNDPNTSDTLDSIIYAYTQGQYHHLTHLPSSPPCVLFQDDMSDEAGQILYTLACY